MAKKKKEEEVVEEGVSRTQEILQKINSSKSSISKFVDMSGKNIEKLKRISTGVLSLDLITGGGWPYGRICEIFGAEASGKSSTCLHSIASCQRHGGVCAFLDSEHGLSLDYASHLGVNVDDLLFQQPSFGEETFQTVLELTEYLRGGDLIIVDSVAALTPRAMYESDMEQKFMGTQAKMMSDGISKIHARLNNCKAVLLFTNQTRQNIGITYGNPTTTPGGAALKFYASIRAEVKSSGKLKKGDNVYGNKTKFKTVKNKTYPPFKEIETSLIFGEGIPVERDLISLGTGANIITKGGSWYSFGEIRIGQGEDNVAEFLKENDEIRQEIENLVRGFYGI